MDQWSKDVVFLVTALLAGLSGVAAEGRAHKRLTIVGAALAFIFYASLGGALGMFAYQCLGGKEHPEMIIAGGMMVGLRIISPLTAKQLVERIIGAEGKK